MSCRLRGVPYSRQQQFATRSATRQDPTVRRRWKPVRRLASCANHRTAGRARSARVWHPTEAPKAARTRSASMSCGVTSSQSGSNSASWRAPAGPQLTVTVSPPWGAGDKGGNVAFSARESRRDYRVCTRESFSTGTDDWGARRRRFHQKRSQRCAGLHRLTDLE